MWDFSILRALGLLLRTAPFLVFRLAVYFGIALALVLVTGAGAGIGYGIGAFGDESFRVNSTFWGGAAGFGLVGGLVFFLRDYLLYLVKAAHIALMVEHLEGRKIPAGSAQVAFARRIVGERFGQASALFALDRLVRGVIAVVTRALQGMMAVLPVPGLDRLALVVRSWLRLAVGLVDEAVLAHALRSRSENAWEAAHDGLVLYAQNARSMLVNAAWLVPIVWLLALGVFLLALAPAAGLAALLPGTDETGALGPVLAVIFAWAVKAAVIEPFALACMLQVFLAVTAGQQPLPEWRGRLMQISDRFRQLGEQAVGWTPERAKRR